MAQSKTPCSVSSPVWKTGAFTVAFLFYSLEKAEKRSQLDILSDLFSKATNIDIYGIVIKLQDEVEKGKATMMGCVVGKLHKIEVELQQPDYQLAIKAYQERIPVVCTGDLSKEGEVFVLKNPRNFALQQQE